jgi:hypothetical protein
MKNKEEIEKLANKYSSLGQAAGLSNREYTLENIAYRRGYEQCQQDMADKWISVEVEPNEGQYVLIYGRGGRMMTALFTKGKFMCYEMITEMLEEAEYIDYWMPLPNKLNKQE